MLTIAEAVELINNLDYREALRRFGPEWAIVVVNLALNVETVQRFKERPTVDQANALMDSYPGCAYFYTHPGMYGTTDSLKQRVDACAEALRAP